MKERIRILMESEGLSPKRLAEILNTQPSNISHLLSGRNKPGFDLIANILSAFPRINPYWLILGRSPMYIGNNATLKTGGSDKASNQEERPTIGLPLNTPIETLPQDEVEQVVIFFKNGEFKSYKPYK